MVLLKVTNAGITPLVVCPEDLGPISIAAWKTVDMYFSAGPRVFTFKADKTWQTLQWKFTVGENYTVQVNRDLQTQAVQVGKLQVLRSTGEASQEAG